MRLGCEAWNLPKAWVWKQALLARTRVRTHSHRHFILLFLLIHELIQQVWYFF